MYLRHQELAARFVTNWCFHAPCEIDGSNQPMLKTHNLANKLYKQCVEKHCVCPIYSTISVCRQKLSHWTNVENYRSLLINTYLWQPFVYIRCPVTNSITTLFIGDRAGGGYFGRNISHYTIMSIVFHNYLHFDINILILFIYLLFSKICDQFTSFQEQTHEMCWNTNPIDRIFLYFRIYIHYFLLEEHLSRNHLLVQILFHWISVCP